MAAAAILSDDVLTLDIGGTKIAAAVGDRHGRLWRRRSISTEPDGGAERVLERALALTRAVLEETWADGFDVVALGVSTMGLTREDRVELAPNVPGWDQLVLPAALRESFSDLPIAIGNDVKVATLAELRWGALSGVRCGAYLNLGTGVAAGLVLDGDVVDGAHGAAGEIGYWLLRDSGEPLAVNPGAVPSEEAYGGRGVARRATEIIGRPVDIVELLELAGSDPSARALLEDVWAGIAALAANLAIVWDPEVLVLGGGYLRSASLLVERVTAAIVSAVPYPPTVARAHFGADASLHGAAALAYRQLGHGPQRANSEHGISPRSLTWSGPSAPA